MFNKLQKQPSRGDSKKRSSENIKQIYNRTTMPKCDFNYNHSSAGVFYGKFVGYFQKTFL